MMRKSSCPGASLSPVQQVLSADTVEFIEKFVNKLGPRYASAFGLDDLGQMGQVAQAEAMLDYDPALADLHEYVKWRVRYALLNAYKKELPHKKALLCRAYMEVCFGLAEASDPCDAQYILSGTEADDQANADTFAGGLLAGALGGVVGEVLRGSGEEGLAVRQLFQRAVEAVREESAKLPEIQQEILDLFYAQGIPLKEIAILLKRHYSTIREHHTKALAELARRLARRGIRVGGDAGLRW
jgi:RNA polymerase sigma factor (sigma-70 family)